jgi:hypothetical protein
VVDIAWDSSRSAAHVVWAQSGSGGQRPVWAAVRAGEDSADALFEEPLAEAGTSAPVLVNVATDGFGSGLTGVHGSLTATFRRGDSPDGWWSRTAAGGGERPEWGPEEQLPIDGEVSGAALTMDARGNAHLVVHETASGRLAYLRRTGRTGWGSPETAVEPPEEGALGGPVLSVDEASRIVYAFFERSRPGEPTRVELAVRDPATGWEGAYEIVRPSDTPRGSIFPNSLASVFGQAIVTWTSPTDPPRIQVARVTAP